ncbi:hypothetical protein [Dyadobacter alkalitolerans]|uniref:hypothetical protein n=1 Tax=Dyadobacter alkalitolerans TaxID=492736 RepID=UPI000410A9FC|nr:hypothetical protein [Dyadobacter alkalitolerans]
MMCKIISYGPIALFLVASLSCQPDQQKSETLVEANNLHIESFATAEKIQQKLDSIKKTTTDKSTQAKLDSIGNLVKLWEGGLIEVPGFAHEHHHGSHDHKPAPQMTDQSMLEFQRNAKQAIEQIGKQVSEPLQPTDR